MSYTFGAAASDRINLSTSQPVSWAVDNGSFLVAGWFYPTTLTATRKYWGAGAIIGAQVDTTTSEIRMFTDNTTDGQWLTSGAGIVTNKWQFIAWHAATENTTVAGEWRVWVGDGDTPPTEVTVTNPTPRSGNYTASATSVVGNDTAGTVAFQGDISNVLMIAQNSANSANPLPRQTSGVISNAEAEYVLKKIVEPLWRGDFDPNVLITGAGNNLNTVVFDLSSNPAVIRCVGGSTGSSAYASVTITGATFTQHEPPRRIPGNCNWMRPVRAR